MNSDAPRQEKVLPQAERCKRLAAMLRAKADHERDPEIKAEWQYIARGYSVLAKQFEPHSNAVQGARRSGSTEGSHELH